MLLIALLPKHGYHFSSTVNPCSLLRAAFLASDKRLPRLARNNFEWGASFNMNVASNFSINASSFP
jgi:hypothetical protein